MPSPNDENFSPRLVISEEEVNEFLYEILIGDEPNVINIGEGDIERSPDIIIPFMDEWTSRIDVILRNFEIDFIEPEKGLKSLSKKQMKRYVKTMEQRGVSFAEYLDLFDLTIEQADFHKHKIFRYYSHLQTNSKRKHFIRTKEPDEQGYTQAITSRQQATKEDKLAQSPPPFKLSAISFFFSKIYRYAPYDDLKRGALVTGRAGSGKTEFIKIIFYDLQKKSSGKNSNTLIAFDFQNDFIEELKVLRLNLANLDRLVYINPVLDKHFTPVINPLELTDRSERNIIVMSEKVAEVFDEIVDDRVSGRMKMLLTPCIAVLMRREGSTLFDLQRFMIDGMNDDLVALGQQSPNEAEARFFTVESGFQRKTLRTTREAVYDRLQQLLGKSTFLNFTCGKSTIDLEHCFNSGKVILFNLSEGKHGVETTSVIGRFMVGLISGYAQRRVYTDKRMRIPSFCFIDEFHTIMSDSIPEILAKRRQQGLHLVLANQHIQQIDEKWRNDLMTNTDVKVVGRNSNAHFGVLAPNMGVKKEKLLALKKYRFYAKAGDKEPIFFKSPSFMLGRKNLQFYLSPDEEIGLDNYFLHKSGYYRRIEKQEQRERGSRQDEKKQEQRQKQNPTSPTKGKRKFRFKTI